MGTAPSRPLRFPRLVLAKGVSNRRTVPGAPHSLFTRAKLWSAAARCRFPPRELARGNLNRERNSPPASWLVTKRQRAAALQSFAPYANGEPFFRNLCAPQTYGEKSGSAPADPSLPSGQAPKGGAILPASERGFDPFRCHRQLQKPGAGGIKHGIGNHCPHTNDRRLSAPLSG